MPEPESPALLHQYLRHSAAERPDSVAVEDPERAISFGQLWRDATGLAAAMASRGLGKGDRVALVLPKSSEAITSLFATLIAGGVYVPIHPRWPEERIAVTIEDCAPRFVIRESAGGPLVNDLGGGTTLAWRDAIAAAGEGPPEVSLEPGDPAVILFTSGSTGRPKGVLLSHRAVGAFVEWTAAEFGIGSRDRLGCPSPLNFDLSTFDVFNMAWRGATCVLIPDEVIWHPRFLNRFVAQRRITAWYSVPSVLAGMLGEGGFTPGRCPELRLILFAGEVFPSRQLAALRKAFPGIACYNLYGPTETNVVTYYRVPVEVDPASPVPIGVACPYAEVRVDAGELLAGGASLMSGYWDRPEETARAFVEAPGAGHPLGCPLGAAPMTFYRTGDRALVDGAGNYVFLGRIDRQVKRRGYRIELGEIEAALGGCPGVEEAAALAADDVIVAFVRLSSLGRPSELEIRTHCARSLPSYSMPDEISFVETLPRDHRGKIDFAKLKSLYAERWGR